MVSLKMNGGMRPYGNAAGGVDECDRVLRRNVRARNVIWTVVRKEFFYKIMGGRGTSQLFFIFGPA